LLEIKESISSFTSSFQKETSKDVIASLYV